MGTMATRDFYERDGVRTNMVNGRHGIAEAMQTSPATQDTKAEVIDFRGTIAGSGVPFEVCTSKSGGRFSVTRQKGQSLNVKLRGAGSGDSSSVLRSLTTGERYADGSVDRQNPAIRRLVFEELLVDVRGMGEYPVTTGMGTVIGTFGLRRFVALSDGGITSKGCKTIIRGNASPMYRYFLEDGDAPNGTREYLGYFDAAGKRNTVMRNLKGYGFGRGLLQLVRRWNNLSTDTIHEDGELYVEDLYAEETGWDGSNVVSLNGWNTGKATIRNVNCMTQYNTGCIGALFDVKICEVTGTGSGGSGGNFKIQDRGLLLESGHALGHVTIDLRGCDIETGRRTAGQQHLSQRAAVKADSAEQLWLVSDDNTSVRAGVDPNHGGVTTRSLELEPNGAGDIRTHDGTKVVGSRALAGISTSGEFDGWEGGMWKAGQPYSVDGDRSPRG